MGTVNLPASDAELYAFLQQRFGIGGDTGLPYYRDRMAQIAQIKALRNKRGVTIQDLAIAAVYAAENNRAILHHSWLYPLISTAEKWWLQRNRAEAESVFEQEYSAAIQQEESNPDNYWHSRLVRAAGDYRKTTLEEWRNR